MAMPVAERDRWLALALLLAVLGIGYLLLVHPWWTAPMLAVNQDIAASQERELRVRTQLQQAPQVEAQLAAALVQEAQRPGFLLESSAELATAGLVQRLETVVVQASPGNRSCAISNRSPMPQPGRERFERVVVQVRLRCGTPELAAVLHALESGTPRLFIDNLNVLAQRYAYVSAAPAAGSGGLDVSFDLYGYLRPVAGATAANAAGRPAARRPQVTAAQGGMDGI
ncbi:general secretion pathway protein GspM [Pseudoxanthomonas gei]|uniref:General secretion pathway protein GspM n=1 Tax=Pseudoxanthomonas gei TaxID=1383030 RepID=A0ABX0A964_9GAMM|nr:type II secretion system protein GspM [Pseudoxanthomonas gei]NDK38037.1 general secretion pathway protein GspM [Pseudoxanthomonas gei]